MEENKLAAPEYTRYAGLSESSSWWRTAMLKLHGRDLAIAGIVAITWLTIESVSAWPGYVFALASNTFVFTLGWRVPRE
jgi:hypothetical protein